MVGNQNLKSKPSPPINLPGFVISNRLLGILERNRDITRVATVCTLHAQRNRAVITDGI